MPLILMNQTAEVTLAGVHSNPRPPLGAHLEGVEHHHVFRFKCARALPVKPLSWSAVNFQNEVREFITEYFTEHSYGCLNFEQQDCVTLAELLMSRLNLNYCVVTEEGVGGIELYRTIPIDNFEVQASHLSKVKL
jgi:hypothetical protein